MRRTKLEKWIWEVEGVPTLDREGLERLQLERLNALFRRERARRGFYSSLPERLGSLAELAELPFTTARELEEFGGAMLLTSQSEAARVITERTSGTTGRAKRVFFTRGDCEKTVGFFAAGLSELVHPGDAVMIAMPFSGAYGLGELIADAIERLGARPLKTGVGRSFGELAEALKREAPAVYVGMPVPLLSLLRFCGGDTPIRRALISGDACPEGVVAETERLLGSRLFPHYGCRETGLGGAVTCAAHEGMHLRENHIIAEIADAEGKVLPEGDWGELVVTTVGMEAMPLIRYRTGDRARILPKPCPCGGVTRRIEVVSRISDAPDMSALDSALFRLPGLVDCSASLSGEGLRLELRSAGGACARAAAEAAGRLFPNIPISCSERSASAADKPLYAGKRTIQR